MRTNLLDMDDAYASFIDELEAGGFVTPAAGQWSAAQIAAHVARNHEALITVTEAVLSGDETSYNNDEQIQERLLDAYAAEYGSLRGLADRIAVTTTTLRELAARLEDDGLTEVPVVIRDGDEIVIDQPMPWAKVLEIEHAVHGRRHLAQLRALRPE